MFMTTALTRSIEFLTLIEKNRNNGRFIVQVKLFDTFNPIQHRSRVSHRHINVCSGAIFISSYIAFTSETSLLSSSHHHHRLVGWKSFLLLIVDSSSLLFVGILIFHPVMVMIPQTNSNFSLSRLTQFFKL